MIPCILQARLGSTRLPNKILLPFYGEESILSIIINKLRKLPNTDVILATTDNERDSPLVDIAKSHQVKLYRGSESDVLGRFIGAAREYGANRIIRICSDNPFIDIESLKTLLKESECSNTDYISFLVNGKPSIKTHFGFWAEFTTLDALEKVQAATQESIYHEHVTNYIYTHPDQFRIKWLKTPDILNGRNDIRLTIDTFQDFTDAQAIYEKYITDNMTIEELVAYLDKNPEIIDKMKEEIKLNSK